MIPMNNPMMTMMQMARAGKNPMMLMQQMAGQNPQAAQIMQMMQGKSPQQLRSIAENMAKERGITINQFANQLGLQIPESK